MINSEVILPKYTSQKINFDNSDYVLATSSEILGVFNNETQANASAGKKSNSG